MSRPVRKRDLQALVDNAAMFCDHVEGEHAPGHCDLLLISPGEITQLLEESREESR